MAEYNPSKIIKDGNTYNFRDTTKIPLAGSNEISGSLIPSTDGTVNLGSPSYQWNNAYIKSLTINGVVCGDILTHNASEFASKATTLNGYGITDAYTKTQVDNKISGLVNSAPETLNTLNELASALGNDPNFATTVANQIGTKANDSDVVHRSKNETIKGSKYFDGDYVDVNAYRLRIKNTIEVAGELPTDENPWTSNRWNAFNFVDKNYVRTFELSRGAIRNGWTFVNFGVLNNTTNTWIDFLKYEGNNDVSYVSSIDFVPLSDNTYELGSSTRKWSKVYSDDVVHTTGDETVGGSKIFSDASTGVGKDVYHFATIPYGKNTPPVTASTQYIYFSGNTASQGFENGWLSGYIEQTVQANGGSRCRWLIRNTDEKNASVELLSAGNTLAFRPSVDNVMLLGLNSHKWKSVYSNAYYLGSTAFGDIVIHNSSEFVPVTGGAVITNYFLGRSVDTENLMISGGTSWSSGGSLETFGSNHSSHAGQVRLQPATSGTNFKTMNLEPSGTWSWSGTACQITSDQRYKQQITEINDKLLDAWEDVELVQFKYNESVDTKGKSARLHTGYVVQQIDSACKSHGVNISEYGLYCHEEYPEETEEVEVENEDGTKTKERKVIREASEHYSLRYTEIYAVECMYLRRCIKQLTARIEELEKGNNSK